MSSRALRRLGQDDLEATLSKFTKDSGKAQESKQKPVRNVGMANIFSLIGDEDEDENEDEDASGSESETKNQVQEKANDTEISKNNIEEKHELLDSQPKTATKVSTKSQKKKNKKKQKNKCQQKRQEPSDEGSDTELDRIIQQFQKQDAKISGKTVSTYDSESEYDTAQEEEEGLESEQNGARGKITLDIRSDPGFSKFKGYSQYPHFFSLDFKKLNPDNEFKLLFDDLSPESLDDVDSMTSTHISPQVLKQINRMKRLVRNWGGKDRKTVPNGGSVRRLQFTKIRDDWLPTPRGEFAMKSLTGEELLQWQSWQRPLDWKDVIKEDVDKLLGKYGLQFYKFEALNTDLNKNSMSEFYLSVVLHPDHEALINLISSKFPYHVPGLLQVALILVRQGDKSNSNGLVERALFVFDRALRSGIEFNATSCQLPYIFFFNRQFYLAIFRYLQIISQRGAISTASEWCKVLWSLSPLEDPLGCRYFMDYYILMNKDYQYFISLANSPLLTNYRQWYTLGMALGVVLSYLRVGESGKARNGLLKAFTHHSFALAQIFMNVTIGDAGLVVGLENTTEAAVEIETKAYLVRMKALWSAQDLVFLHDELSKILQDYQSGKLEVFPPAHIDIESQFFIKDIPINLLRFAILSQESSVMASIPEEIWTDYQVFEFDVLPPTPIDRETEDIVETIKSFVSDDELSVSQVQLLQDEQLLNHVRQMSLEQFLEQNPNAGVE